MYCEKQAQRLAKPGEGGGLRRSKRRSGGDKRAHGRHGATWRSCSRRVVSLGACRGRRGTCDERGESRGGEASACEETSADGES